MTRGRKLTLEWVLHHGRSSLKVSGWTEPELRELGRTDAGDISRHLALFPSEALAGGVDGWAVPPVAGRFTLEQDCVCFVSRFSFVDGTSYSLVVDPGSTGQNPEVWAILRPPVPAAPVAEVVAIYPSAVELPVNLLRVYVHFSAPMSEGGAGRAIQVRRSDTGEALEDVFLPPEPELWDPERRRLTMLLDPGRIKRGLVPNLESGYPLIEGIPITVSVTTDLRDAGGSALKAGAERHYRIGPVLRSRINASDWQLTAPPVGSRSPLLLEFGRSLDHGLLQHSLRVCDAAGETLPGDGAAGEQERSWRFTPSTSWADDEYRLVVEPRLEDVAGNSPVRVFDRDVSKPEDSPSQREAVTVSFSCAPAALPLR